MSKKNAFGMVVKSLRKTVKKEANSCTNGLNRQKEW
jgi:hypothetical protein